jgi:hypothetical protein
MVSGHQRILAPAMLSERIRFLHIWKLLLGDERDTVNSLQKLSDNYSIWSLSNANPKHIRDEIEKRYTFPNLVSGAVYSFNVDYVNHI